MILAAESKDSLDNWDRSSVFMGMPFESSELTSISFIFIGQFMENLSHKFHYLGHFLPVMWVVSSCSFYPWTVAKQNTIFLLLSLRTWMEQRNFQVQCHSLSSFMEHLVHSPHTYHAQTKALKCRCIEKECFHANYPTISKESTVKIFLNDRKSPSASSTS